MLTQSVQNLSHFMRWIVPKGTERVVGPFQPRIEVYVAQLRSLIFILDISFANPLFYLQ
jgi:hypothetical protein